MAWLIESIEVLLPYRIEQNANANRLIDLPQSFLSRGESPDALHRR
jgi:hypothetical protein